MKNKILKFLDFGLIIGISVSVVLIVVIAVIGFVYWKKRRTNSSEMSVDLSGLVNKNFDSSDQNY